VRLSAAVLGAGAVKQLEDTAADAVLVIGSDRLTRAELAAIGCFNFHAARLLSKVLHTELRVKNLRQVFEKIAPVDLALPTVGVISLAVLGAAFEAKGIGGDAPLENYVRRHSAKMQTFSTMKQHVRKREHEQQPRTTRRRKDQVRS